MHWFNFSGILDSSCCCCHYYYYCYYYYYYYYRYYYYYCLFSQMFCHSLCWCSFCASVGRKPCTWSISHSSQSFCSYTNHCGSEDPWLQCVPFVSMSVWCLFCLCYHNKLFDALVNCLYYFTVAKYGDQNYYLIRHVLIKVQLSKSTLNSVNKHLMSHGTQETKPMEQNLADTLYL